MLSLLLTNLALILGVQFIVWLVSLKLRDASVADPVWGPCFVLLGWSSWLQSGAAASLTSVMLLTMATIWGTRLGGYLLWRNWGKEEDRRYGDMREKHGRWFPLVSLLTVFGLQAILCWIIGLPLQMGIALGGDFSWVTACGMAIWAIGLGFETIGDWQLASFKADPANRGEVMDSGLWRWTRHPNYFGDFLVWWGIYVVSTGSGVVWPTLIGPVLMSFLLLRVSGVSLLEGSLKKRLSSYDSYASTTSPFIPWPPGVWPLQSQSKE
ncbi:hypothetical protein Mal64_32180 [Pseudobythopirellula maris]|uniref:Uncharacterized protein n=1 Tax=Pseudobythopirellula maris TaxID=2527991 RepID=A0A5C5ZKE6_9BACT|nr:DUF1295 domain-containing protein [Pseudobythopirellula maris]TWT87676.1 hypothetical protein Mal64_32180 [Pseudobythopirellula maris]